MENIKKAISMTLEHKYLWIMGALGVFVATFSINYEPGQYGYDQTIIFIGLFVMCFNLIWLGVNLVVSNITAAGLIKSSDEILKGNKHSFKESWNYGLEYGLKYFGQLFILTFPIILLSIIIGIILFVVMIGSISTGNFNPEQLGPGMFFIFCMLICGIVFIAFILGIIQIFASRELIIANKGIIESIKSGYKIVTNNFGEIFVNGLLYILSGFVFGLILITIVFIFAFVFGLTYALTLSLNLPTILFFILMIIISFIYSVVISIVGAPFMVYSQNFWTVVYTQLVGEQKEEKVAVEVE